MQRVAAGWFRPASTEVEKAPPAPPPDAEPELAAFAARLATLSPAQMTCLRLRARGLSNREVAEAMSVAPGTVRGQFTAVYRKLIGEARDDRHRYFWRVAYLLGVFDATTRGSASPATDEEAA